MRHFSFVLVKWTGNLNDQSRARLTCNERYETVGHAGGLPWPLQGPSQFWALQRSNLQSGGHPCHHVLTPHQNYMSLRSVFQLFDTVKRCTHWVIIMDTSLWRSQSQWPCGLTHELSSSAQTLWIVVRISLAAWTSVCFYSVFVLFYV
jgi:hypothetical protein